MELGDTLPGQREVHVWFVELHASNTTVETCARSLSTDERERVSRFRFLHLKNDFTLSRGILRILLGRYLAIEPDRLRFAYGPRGKPRLAMEKSPLEFNLAHSGRFAAYAFAAGFELGVDIEEVRPIPDQENIVRRYFSQEECEEWLGLDLTKRNDAFFRCWTKKEAYLKALGDGLSIPLNSFSVSLRPGELVAGEWSLCSMVPADGYICSLAVPHRGGSVRILPRLTAEAVLELARGTTPFPPEGISDRLPK